MRMCGCAHVPNEKRFAHPMERSARTKREALAVSQYANDSMWYKTGRTVSEEKTDVFYVVSTMILESYDDEGNPVTRTLLSPEDRAALDEEINDIATNMFDESFNFFAPYYHEGTMHGMLALDEAAKKELVLSIQEEVTEAFNYYMDHFNGGRPFVLAGYSQGSIMVKGVLRNMTDEQYRLMAAAYVMGGPLTAADLEKPFIVPARGAEDLGVTVSYNSVASLDACWAPLTGSTVECINPLNWTTDEQPASFTYRGEQGTVHLDTQAHMLIVEGIDPAKHYKPDWPFPFGNYHNDEIHFYAEAIKQNALLRLGKMRG